MQTFLPYESFIQSARVLDYRRLGKQRVEAKQILMALAGVTKGWRNHPATKMWRGYEGQLCVYGITMCNEWKLRGYQDSLLPFFQSRLAAAAIVGELEIPHWLGNKDLHLSHQSNLLRKDSNYYRVYFGDDVPDDLPYVWLSGNEANQALSESSVELS